MRQYLALFMLLGGCAPPSPAYQPPPAAPLTGRGLPPAYEACVQRRAQQTADMYDVYSDCRQELVYYLAQTSQPQEAKADRISDFDRLAMNYAQEQVEAQQTPEAVRRTLPMPPVPAVASEEDAQMRQWAECSLHTIMGAHQAGWDATAILGLAKSTCGYLWTGTPEGAERLYGKMLASVRAADPGYSVSPSVPGPPREMRF